jgi:hypothetical protein
METKRDAGKVRQERIENPGFRPSPLRLLEPATPIVQPLARALGELMSRIRNSSNSAARYATNFGLEDAGRESAQLAMSRRERPGIRCLDLYCCKPQ